MRSRPILGSDDARAILDAAVAYARAAGLPVSVAVVDEAGVLLALQRCDEARLHTPQAAELKARTAAITRTPTSVLQAQVKAEPAQLLFPGRLPLTGALPLTWQGDVVGAIGSSGGQPDEDVAVCEAGLAALATLSRA